MLPIIALNNITKIYRSGETELKALNQVNLTIFPGELTAIVGESGSGKSTLLNMIGLLDRPTFGTYHIGNVLVDNMTDDELSAIRNQKIGFVFQSFFLLPRLTALQNVIMPLVYRGVSDDIAKTRALEMLSRMGIEHFWHHKPNQMSGGQQQRVALARALVGEPDVILADEPTGALDSKTGQEVMELFIELNTQEKKTVIVVTHDLHISAQCRRVVRVRDGNVMTED